MTDSEMTAQIEKDFADAQEKVRDLEKYVRDRDREIQMMEAGSKAFPLWADFLELQKVHFSKAKDELQMLQRVVKIMELVKAKIQEDTK